MLESMSHRFGCYSAQRKVLPQFVQLIDARESATKYGGSGDYNSVRCDYTRADVPEEARGVLAEACKELSAAAKRCMGPRSFCQTTVLRHARQPLRQVRPTGLNFHPGISDQPMSL